MKFTDFFMAVVPLRRFPSLMKEDPMIPIPMQEASVSQKDSENRQLTDIGIQVIGY